MTEISFTINLQPRGQARARSTVVNGHARMYKAAKQRLAEESLAALIAPHRPPAPFTGPVLLAAILYCPVPRSWSRKKQAAALSGATFHTSKPDLDNAVKHLMDVMKGLFYRDDRQIVGLSAAKHYGDPPRWVVTVREVAA